MKRSFTVIPTIDQATEKEWTTRITELLNEGTGNISALYDEFANCEKLRVAVKVITAIPNVDRRRRLLLRFRNRIATEIDPNHHYKHGTPISRFSEMLHPADQMRLNADTGALLEQFGVQPLSIRDHLAS